MIISISHSEFSGFKVIHTHIYNFLLVSGIYRLETAIHVVLWLGQFVKKMIAMNVAKCAFDMLSVHPKSIQFLLNQSMYSLVGLKYYFTIIVTLLPFPFCSTSSHEFLSKSFFRNFSLHGVMTGYRKYCSLIFNLICFIFFK